MPITHFSFNDNKENWHLEEISFDKLNLLVGVSGVGKTKILKALELACHVATGGDYKLNGEDWKIGFKYADHEYEWTLKSALIKPKFSSFAPSEFAIISSEEIVKDQNIKLLTRRETKSGCLLNDQKVPRFKNTESAINILSEVKPMRPIYEALKRVIFNEIWQQKHFAYRLNPAENHAKPPAPFEKFQEESTQIPTVVKAYRLQQRYPDEFDKIKQVFTDIFSSVEDIKVNLTKTKEAGGVYEFYFILKEKTHQKWITQWNMSSGMFRTLVHLVEISLAPLGSVIVIDELENGLGSNCMPGLTDFILNKASHLQRLLSSHHPYIINRIPDKTWKLVTRKGGQVSVINGTDIPQLQTESSTDKFIQLTRLPEYKNAI
jgi:AAA15 family ATPase/GTPase